METTMPTSATIEPLPGVALPAPAWSRRAQLLLPLELLSLVARLHRDFEPARRRLLGARAARQARWDAGELPGWLAPGELPECRGEWRIAPLPTDLMRRRVEITG